MFEKLPDKQKAEILNEFIIEINENATKDLKSIYGYTQIIEMLENIAIEKHFIKCPYCKR